MASVVCDYNPGEMKGRVDRQPESAVGFVSKFALLYQEKIGLELTGHRNAGCTTQRDTFVDLIYVKCTEQATE